MEEVLRYSGYLPESAEGSVLVPDVTGMSVSDAKQCRAGAVGGGVSGPAGHAAANHPRTYGRAGCTLDAFNDPFKQGAGI